MKNGIEEFVRVKEGNREWGCHFGSDFEQYQITECIRGGIDIQSMIARNTSTVKYEVVRAFGSSRWGKFGKVAIDEVYWPESSVFSPAFKVCEKAADNKVLPRRFA